MTYDVMTNKLSGKQYQTSLVFIIGVFNVNIDTNSSTIKIRKLEHYFIELIERKTRLYNKYNILRKLCYFSFFPQTFTKVIFSLSFV